MISNARVIFAKRGSCTGGHSVASTRERSLPAVISFVKTAAMFLAGLSLVLWTVDSALGWWARRSGWRKLPGTQVYEAKAPTHRPGPRVKAIYLGDSVARQLFRPGQEPGEDARYLASTGAVGVAGQFYLLQTRCENAPMQRTLI